MPTCSTLLPKPFIPLGPKMVAPFLMNNWSFHPLFPTIVQAFLFGHFTVFTLKLPQTRPPSQTGWPSLLAISWLLPRTLPYSKSPTHSIRATRHWLLVFSLGFILQTTCCWTQLSKWMLSSSCFPRWGGGTPGEVAPGWTLDSSITAASTQE